MEFQSSSDQRKLTKENLLKIILIVIGGILILAIFLMIGCFRESISKNLKYQISEGDETKPRKEQEIQVILPEILYTLTGTIQKLEKESFVFEASIVQLDKNNQISYKTETRKVSIATTTKITRLSFVSSGDKDQKYPQEAVISYNDLKVKDYIEVISDEDISQAPEIIATQICVLPQ